MPSAEQHQTFVFDQIPSTGHVEAPLKSLSEFVISDCNRDACHKVIGRVSAGRAGATFVHGPLGCGKTHLLQGISRNLQSGYVSLSACRDPDALEGFFSSLLNRSAPWIVDDIQHLCGLKEGQSTVYNAFSSHLRSGGHILVACDRSLDDLLISGLGRQFCDLLAKFEVAEIAQHDEKLVRDYLTNRFGDAANCPDGGEQRVIEIVARYQFPSMHAVKAATSALIMIADMDKLSDQTIIDVIQSYTKHQPMAAITLERIRDRVCEVFGVSADEIASKSRLQIHVRARHALCVVARRLTPVSLVAIGDFINRDHTTIIHAVKKGEELSSYDPAFGEKVGAVLRSFRR